MAVTSVHRKIEEQHGFEYAEGFRRDRFGLIPRLAHGQEPEEFV